MLFVLLLLLLLRGCLRIAVDCSAAFASAVAAVVVVVVDKFAKPYGTLCLWHVLAAGRFARSARITPSCSQMARAPRLLGQVVLSFSRLILVSESKLRLAQSAITCRREQVELVARVRSAQRIAVNVAISVVDQPLFMHEPLCGVGKGPTTSA